MPGAFETSAKTLLRSALDPACKLLPEWLSASLLERWGSGMDVALCFHRVLSQRRAGDPLPSQTISPEILDGFLEIARRARDRGQGPERLTLTFDDGYRDAVDYVASRAPLYPEIEWLVFVCPEKLVSRAGYRWDLWEVTPSTRRRPLELEGIREETHPALENRRPELRALGDSPDFVLASVESCLALLEHPNVALGNHSNSHLALALLDEETSRREIEESTRGFEELFGQCRHFAFPFGVPGLDFGTREVEVLRRCAPGAVLWSSEHRPYHPPERCSGAVLPRIAVRGDWSAKTLATWVALLARREAARGLSEQRQSYSPASRTTEKEDDAMAGAG
ncbi:MAG: hypothetical protein ACOC0J_01365 [Myxococcota bacterium]